MPDEAKLIHWGGLIVIVIVGVLIALVINDLVEIAGTPQNPHFA